MKRTLLSALVLAGTALLSQGALASDGKIDFTGAITGSTCTINQGSGGSNFTVKLPTVLSSTMVNVGSFAGRQPFEIALTNCGPTGTVRTNFESGSLVDVANGTLKTTTGPGTAVGVQIQLRNNDTTKINVGAAIDAQNSSAVTIAGGSATLKYYAEYLRTGDITPGSVTSAVFYTMVYN